VTRSVTVLLCSYNDAPTLPRALDSVLTQTLSRDRFGTVLIDDGSRDGTAEALAPYRAEIELVRLPENRGLPAAANAGLERIETPFFVRLDADDVFAPELLEALLETADREEANLVYPDRIEVTSSGERTVRLGPQPEIGQMVAAGKLLPTGLVRRLGGYRELFWEEIDLYLRLLESGEVETAHVPRPLYRYTVGQGGRMTDDVAAVRRGWEELRELWPEDVLVGYGLGTDYPVGCDRP
jgi:glycosyltransferase involved in cell wall biosynthesis